MDLHASGWFEAVETPKGWAYALRPGDRGPRAGLGCLVLFASVLTAPGAVFLGFAASMAPGFGWREVWGPAFLWPLAALAAGAWLAIVVLHWRLGRDELRLDAGAIRAVRRLGPISWSKAVRRPEVAEFTVVRKSWFPDDGTGRVQRHVYHALAVEDGLGRRRVLVENYPREMLLALAAELSSRWKALSVDPDPIGVGPGKLAVAEDSEIPTDIRERLYAPRGTRLLFERQGERGVRITRPPDVDLRVGCETVALLGFGAATVLGLLTVLGVAGTSGWMGTAGCVLIFAVALLVRTVAEASGFVLIATPDLLVKEADGRRGTCRKAWEKREITSIRAETKVDTDGEGTTYTTRVLIRGAHSIRPEPDVLLSGMPKPELEWIATTLRGVLGVSASDPPTADEIRARANWIDPA